MTNFRLLLRRLHKYNLGIGLFISSWLVPVITNLLSSWLQQQFGSTQATLIQLCAIGLVLLVGLWVFSEIIEKIEAKNVVTKEMQPDQFPGLIILIGPGRPESDPQNLSHNVAIKYHLKHPHDDGLFLRVCWLIATAGEKGSVDLAQKVREQYKTSGIKIVLHVLKDAFDVQEAYETVQKIYEQEAAEHDLLPGQIISDFTGGTKPMSAGMILACQDQWPLQYVYGRIGVIQSAPVLIRFQSKKKRQKR